MVKILFEEENLNHFNDILLKLVGKKFHKFPEMKKNKVNEVGGTIEAFININTKTKYCKILYWMVATN